MKYIFFFISIVVLYLFYGFLISKIDLNPTPSQTTITQDIPKLFNDYKGVINVHSTQGVGQGSVPEILKDAYLSKLDFIIFTESLVYERPIEAPSYSGGVLVLHGREYSYLKSRLILLDNSHDFSQITSAAAAQLYISDLLENPGSAFIILNHPTKPGYEWDEEVSANLSALEIINLRANWSEAWSASKLNFIRALLIYPFNADYAFLNLFQPPTTNLKLWNKLNKTRPTVGLLGTDAKSKLRIYKHKYLRFPSYKKLFSLGSNHVLIRSELTGHTLNDSKKIYDGLTSGSMYFSLDFVGDPAGFQFYAQAQGHIYAMGAQLKPQQSLEFCVNFPSSHHDVFGTVYLDGQKYMTVKNSQCFKPNQTGAYNFIMTKKIRRPWPLKEFKIPWIISNYIYITE